jgi:hypothetical protein
MGLRGAIGAHIGGTRNPGQTEFPCNQRTEFHGSFAE